MLLESLVGLDVGVVGWLGRLDIGYWRRMLALDGEVGVGWKLDIGEGCW